MGLARLATALVLLGPGPPAEDGARTLPELGRREPEVSVLLARGIPRIELELAEPVPLRTGSTVTILPAGLITLEATPGGWRTLGSAEAFAAAGVFRGGGRPLLALEARPAFGPSQRLRIAGELVVRGGSDGLVLVERVPLERYVASVVGAEMNAGWPGEALAAQAIVARSYATARWMERHAEPWHLHWHFGVDMAYHGWHERDAQVARSIAHTRGKVLIHRGFPLLALFHASSGGRTEAFERVKPGVRAPDGETPIASAMPAVDDPAALPGARELGLFDSHGRWRATIPLSEVSAALEAWSAAGASRPRFGAIESLSVVERHADSGRVATVSLRFQQAGRTRFARLPATDLRLAVSPLRIRSLLWDRSFVTRGDAPGDEPDLVLEGRGFGHGCGLSQVSAWYLARHGRTAEQILARFYPGARIERRY